ncbi:hypothetical protein D3C79_600010 [compost metagenome]
MLGHAVEGRGQAPHRVSVAGRHAGVQAALGDARGGNLQARHTPLQLAHQQVDHQADQAQAKKGDQDQQLRRIGVELVQRADFQHPRRTSQPGEHADRVTILAQGHDRVALLDPAPLVIVQAHPLDALQGHAKAEALFFLDLCQALLLFGHRVAHQFVGQQIEGGPRQLLADLFDLRYQHQVFLADLAQHLGRMRAGLLDHHQAAVQARPLAAIECARGHRLQRQRHAEQALPDQQRALALGVVLQRQVVGHQAEGTLGQALAVLGGTHFVDQVQAEHPEQGHQHQHGQHAAIDAQEDRVVHGASPTNR